MQGAAQAHRSQDGRQLLGKLQYALLVLSAQKFYSIGLSNLEPNSRALFGMAHLQSAEIVKSKLVE